MKKTSKLISLLLVITFSLSTVLPAYTYDNLAPGAISGELRPDGGEVRDAVKGSAGLLHVIKEQNFEPTDILEEEEYFLGPMAGILATPGQRRPLDREEVRSRLTRRDDTQLARLVWAPHAILGECARKSRVELQNHYQSRDFQVGPGEVPLPRLARYTDGKTYLEVPPKFMSDLEILAKNDMFFDITSTQGSGTRYVSLMQGLAYRMGRHELKWIDHEGEFKSGGHLGQKRDQEEALDKDEANAYMIDGKYAPYNDAIMLWYVFSFCQDISVWLSNNNFEQLLRGVSDPRRESDPQAIAFRTYFPQLANDPGRLEQAIDIALWINYHYFIRDVLERAVLGDADDRRIDKMAMLSVLNGKVPNLLHGKVDQIPTAFEDSKMDGSELDWELRGSGLLNKEPITTDDLFEFMVSEPELLDMTFNSPIVWQLIRERKALQGLSRNRLNKLLYNSPNSLSYQGLIRVTADRRSPDLEITEKGREYAESLSQRLDDHTRVENLLKTHKKIFKLDAELVSLAPGRANIIGEHVDYPPFPDDDTAVNLSLPFALPYSMIVSGRRTRDNIIDLYSADFKERFTFHLDDLKDIAQDRIFIENVRENYHWATYFLGMCYAAQQRGERIGGGEYVIEGNIPIGTGLSSSAAYSVAATLLMRDFYGWKIDAVDLARTARQAEHKDFNPFVGSSCGLLDQIASFMSEEDKAILINYGDLTNIEKVDLDLGEYAFVLADSKVARILAETEYNTRVDELTRVPEILNEILGRLKSDHKEKKHVSQFTMSEFELAAEEFEQKEPVLFKRTRHVLTERRRTDAFVHALKVKKIEDCGRLLNESGDSLSMTGDFQISGRVRMADGSYINALDILVEEGRRFGAYGRMMGGGGGGCAIFLLKKDDIPEWRDKVKRAYRKRTGFSTSFYDAPAKQGAGIVYNNKSMPWSPGSTANEFGSEENIRQFAGWVDAGTYASCIAYLRKILNGKELCDNPTLGSLYETALVGTFMEFYVPYLVENSSLINLGILRDIIVEHRDLNKFGLAISSYEVRSTEWRMGTEATPEERQAIFGQLSQQVTEGEIFGASWVDSRPTRLERRYDTTDAYTDEEIRYWGRLMGADTINHAPVVQLERGEVDESQPYMEGAELATGMAGNVIKLRAVIPGYGPIDLIHAHDSYYEIGQNPPPSSGSALLVPFANRQTGEIMPDGRIKVSVAGKDVLIEPNWSNGVHIHGAVADRALENMRLNKRPEGDELSGEINAGDFGTGWPSQTKVTTSTKLEGNVMMQTVNATNVGEEETEIGIGTHPYFTLPGDRSRWLLKVPARKRTEFNKEMLPTGKLLPIDTEDTYNFRVAKVLGDFFLDDCFTDLYDEDGYITVELIDPETGIGIRLTSSSPDIKAIQVYTPKDSNSIAIEFQYNLPDPLNKKIWHGKDSGMVTLKPGQTTTYNLVTEIFQLSPETLREDGMLQPTVLEEKRASRGLRGVVQTRDSLGIYDPRLEGLSDEALEDIRRNEQESHRVLNIGISVIDLLAQDENVLPGTDDYRGSLALLGKIADTIDEDGTMLPEYLAQLPPEVRKEILDNFIGGGPAYSTSRTLAQVSRTLGRRFPSMDIKFVSRARNDRRGKKIRNDLEMLRIDTKDMKPSKGKKNTATTLALEHGGGERTFYHDVGASADLSIEDLKDEFFEGREVVEFGGIELGTDLFKDAEKALKVAKKHGAVTVWDTVVDNPGLWEKYYSADHYKIFESIDVFAPSLEEAARIYMDSGSEEGLPNAQRRKNAHELAQKILDDPRPENKSLIKLVEFFTKRGVKALFLKMGNKGSYVKTTEDSIFKTETDFVMPILPAFRDVTGKGATGTGDAFLAGLIYGVTYKWDPKKTAMFANVVGGMCYEHAGGTLGDKDFVDAMRYMELYRKLEDYRYVGVSMGGTKVLIEVKDGLRRVVEQKDVTEELDEDQRALLEVLWKDPVEKGGFGARGKDVKNSVSADEITELIAREIQNLLYYLDIELDSLDQIYVCTAGPIDETRELLGHPEPTANLPFDNYPLTEELAERLFGKIVDRMNIPVTFVMQHDGKGGVVGEFKEESEVSGTTIIHGTGMNATPIRRGIYYTAQGAVMEWGHATIGTPYPEDRGTGTYPKAFRRHTYRFVGRASGQNHPLQVVESRDDIPKDIRGTPREAQYIIHDEAERRVADGEKRKNFIWMTEGEKDVEDLISGGAIWLMLMRISDLEECFGGRMEDYEPFTTAKDLSEWASKTDNNSTTQAAKRIIEYIAGEMGRALAAYIFEFRNSEDEEIVRNTRMVSTLGEQLGKGVDIDKEGRDIYLRNVQDACEEQLNHLFAAEYRQQVGEQTIIAQFAAELKGEGDGREAFEALDAVAARAKTLSRGISRSPGSADREIQAAAPQVRPYTRPSDDDIIGLSTSLINKGTDYYLSEKLAESLDLEKAEDYARHLGGKLVIFSDIEDLSIKISAQSQGARTRKGKRACIDLAGVKVTQQGLENFFTDNPHAMNARFLNSEVPNFSKLTKVQKELFLKRMLLRMGVMRALEEKDIDELTPRYFFARSYIHPYLPLGFSIDDYIAHVVKAPTDNPEVFVRNLVNTLRAILRYLPIETYDPEDLKRVTEVLWAA